MKKYNAINKRQVENLDLSFYKIKQGQINLRYQNSAKTKIRPYKNGKD